MADPNIKPKPSKKERKELWKNPQNMETDKLLQFIERKPTKKLKSKMTMNSEETQANSQIDDVTTIYSDENEEDDDACKERILSCFYDVKITPNVAEDWTISLWERLKS